MKLLSSYVSPSWNENLCNLFIQFQRFFQETHVPFLACLLAVKGFHPFISLIKCVKVSSIIVPCNWQ
jgi:hypothetical protein